MNFIDKEIDGVVISSLKSKYFDERGWLLEIFRQDILNPEYYPVMSYVSMTLPDKIRGPHEHKFQSDLFAFIGPGTFKIWLWDNRRDSKTFWHRIILTAGENEPMQILIPPGVVHAYKCISKEPAISYNFPNKLYKGFGKKEAIDEIRHENDPKTLFKLQ